MANNNIMIKKKTDKARSIRRIRQEREETMDDFMSIRKPTRTIGLDQAYQITERSRYDFLCVVCKGKSKMTTAETFCIECHDYYCSSCVKCHDDIPPLKTHQIVDNSTAPLPAVPTERCKEHKDKPVDMYCKNHNVVGCSTCILVNHSSCEDMHYIPDFIKTNTTARSSNNVKLQLEMLEDSIKILQKVLMKEKDDLKGNKDKVLKEIGTFRDEINKLLDQFEKNLVQELEQRFKTLTDRIDSSLGELQATAIDINASHARLISAGRNMPQKFVSIMQDVHVVSNSKEKVNKIKSQFSHTEVNFLANKKLQTLFSEIQDLGSIRVREKLRITGRQKYPVNVKSDSETCDINSACTLNDGTIILADKANSKLKLLDSVSYSVTDCCDVLPRPWQVCAISDTEVAVSCNESNLIQLFYVGSKMKKTSQIKTRFHCQGLAHANERLFVSDKESVYMFSLSGKELQRLYRSDIDLLELTACEPNISTLAVNSDKSRIYVAGRNTKLIILDMKGQIVRECNGVKLSFASGVCLDNNDNVLVCDWYSRNVLQFSPDGKLIGEIVKIYGLCRTVCCNKNNSKLIVGYNKNEIEVYDINAE